MGWGERRNPLTRQNVATMHMGNVPIVGQPYQLKHWFPTVQIVCNCEAKEPLMLVGTTSLTACPACKKAYQIAALTFDRRTNKFEVILAMGTPREQPPEDQTQEPPPADEPAPVAT
jgi:hypothetical protein